MANNTRDIRRRIRSIGNTRKVTKAMELVASSKMRRAVQTALRTRPYTDVSWELLLNLAKRADPARHPLLRVEPVPKKIGLIMLASNRGLVGGFNAQITTAVANYIQRLKQETLAEVDLIIMGTKGRALYHQHGHRIAAEFIKQDVVFNSSEVRPMSRLVIDGFTRGDYDRVIVAYVDYISALVQKTRIRQILPLTPESFLQGAVGTLSGQEKKEVIEEEAREEQAFEYQFEPDPDTVLDALLPRLVELQIFRAVLETNASEHAARMMAMRNASDAAADLIDDLTLNYNQARQAAITQDLSEISASRAALET